ncbi:sigma-70 family RNA polymerase sigma factor [Streptomyces sp. NPDC090025]|uniref:sigma-70 family RNA polymerase sigma factor n=1 Tax=Streptomyces sp. NPDC090025 TaxID=3365922 RepID=UPI0038337A24
MHSDVHSDVHGDEHRDGHRDENGTAALVEAARAGDALAEDALVRAHLPLVYNIVGRALDGHADVDDLVQETMVRALDGLPALRDPGRFRSWLVAIALNRVRRRWHERRRAPLPGLERAAALPDPAGDFTELTILRLGLTGQRREAAEATRWLDEDDREVLSLWWLEAAGELTRAELATALEIPPAHAAVRVQRMKGRLETGRALVRALAAAPPCPGLADTTAAWDGRPSPLWRKRLARHLDGCARCAAGRSGLAPAEGLLVGLALVPPLLVWAGRGSGGAPAMATVAADVVPPGPGSGPGPGPGAGAAAGGRRGLLLGGGAVVALGAAVLLLIPGGPTEPDRALTRPVVTTPPSSTPAATTPPPRAPSPTPTPRRSTVPPPRPSPEAEVTRLVNRHRAAAGCGPLSVDPRLSAVARTFGADMVERGYLAHTDPEGTDSGTRLTRAGYPWGAWAENLAQGQRRPKAVVDDWLADPPHRANLLNCRYRHTGVAAVPGPDGTVWVQELAAPSGP